jgi:hypothetical protein
MSRIVTRGLRKQLELKASQQPVHEVIQPQKQPRSQAEGTQLIDVPSNEPQQLVMPYLLLHQILAKQKERRESQVPSFSQFLTPH